MGVNPVILSPAKNLKPPLLIQVGTWESNSVGGLTLSTNFKIPSPLMGQGQGGGDTMSFRPQPKNLKPPLLIQVGTWEPNSVGGLTLSTNFKIPPPLWGRVRVGGCCPQGSLTTQRYNLLMDPVTRSRQLRKNATDAERKMWSILRQRQIADYKFRFQSPIGPYIVDFACPARKLIIEIVGGQHQQRTEEDAIRASWLESQGYRVLRFWNNDVLANSSGVTETILDTLESGNSESPPP